MEIIDLSPQYEKLYFCCLEDWSDEMAESGNHKACWYDNMKDKGLRVKLAKNDKDEIVGMIQYAPSDYTFIEGKGIYLVLCIWVHGYKNKGVGDWRKKGMGKALLRAAEDDVRALGGKGLAVWGLAIPVFMRASWFKKQGYTVVDKDSMIRLLWKPFTEDALPPTLLKLTKKPEKIEGKVNVSYILNGWCPAKNIVYERAKRIAEEFPEKVVFYTIDSFDKEVMLEWGISDALFIDGKQVRTGPPPSFAKLQKKIAKRVKKLG
ncbi:MAG: N-acetyltransferase protein [Ignavibacteria bacterium]|nr:N-acetyltransferase protein [Ignavibacteria bacterium]